MFNPLRELLFTNREQPAVHQTRHRARRGAGGRPLLSLLLGLCLSGLAAEAQVPSDALLDRLQPNGFVTDDAGLLDPQAEQQLEGLLTELERKTTVEIAVVTVKSLEGGEVDDFANRLFEKWGVGKEDRDNGVLFLTAAEDREVRIEVGYGLEGILPDAKAGRLLDDSVLPSFRKGQYQAGIVQGASALAQTVAAAQGVQLTGAINPQPAPRSDGNRLPGFGGILLLILVLLVFLRNPFLAFLLLGGRRRHYGGGGYYRGGFGGGGFGTGGGGFGGFGGGLSGGGGAGRSW